MNKRDLLAALMYHARLHKLVRLSKSSVATLPILAYHRIVDIRDESSFSCDVELVSASCAEFRWQMDYVAQNYCPITFRDLARCLDQGDSLPERPVIVTFDDGYEDTYLNAFPILEACCVPFTLFLTTGSLETGWHYWFVEVAELVKAAATQGVGFSIEGCRFSERGEGLDSLCNDVLRTMKSLPNNRRKAAVEELRSQISLVGCDRTDWARPIGADQVAIMAKSIAEIGAHSVNHPIMTNIDDDDLEFELLQSKHSVEAITDAACDVFAYPDGMESSYDSRVMNAAKNAGFRLACTYVPGVNEIDQLMDFELRRVHVERYTTRARFAMTLAYPGLFL